ncbi:MAG: acetylornithine transaminase [Ruminococcaceae bacterium]|nr:acetylornithine transaminase [Oscillospiraceae bacterium]
MDKRLEAIAAVDEQYYLNAFGKRTPLCFDRGEGIWLYDTAGKKYMDLIGGIAVNVLGHGHPRLVAAICDQAANLIHCSNLYYIENQARLAEKLGDLFGGGRVFIGNSGAEANEGAIKLARGYFYHQGSPRATIVTATHSFHGRTLATATATGQTKYSKPFAPLPSGFVHVPFNDLAALKAAVNENTCAVMLEVIQGESGVNPADQEYMTKAAAWCREKGALLIIDEVQTGMGRSGFFFAYEAYGIKPDIVTLAKGLGGGVPIGALIANEKAATGFEPGDHGSTFGGNPLACAAALAVLETYEAENLTAKAGQLGNCFRNALEQLKGSGASIAEIRGMGLMIGISLEHPIAAAVRSSLAEQGFLVGAVGATTLRLLPPLIITEADIDLFVSILTKTLKEVAA